MVADDVTGGNATGVLLSKEGLGAVTILPDKARDQDMRSRFDALIIPSNSRALPSTEAYARVRVCLSPFREADILQFAKRIDTTLRGNVAAEIDAALSKSV